MPARPATRSTPPPMNMAPPSRDRANATTDQAQRSTHNHAFLWMVVRVLSIRRKSLKPNIQTHKKL